MANPGRVGFLLGAAAVAAAAIAFLTPKDSAPPAPADDAEVNRIMRTTLVDLIDAERANPDPEKYWAEVWKTPGPHPKHWCGALVLWGLRLVGLTQQAWKVEVGFIGPLKLPTTKTPQVGDVAYFAKNQHQAVVASVAPDGSFETLDGNAAGGAIARTTRKAGAATAFYSIQPLIDRLLETSDG